MPNAQHNVDIHRAERKFSVGKMSVIKKKPRAQAPDDICDECSQFNLQEALASDFEGRHNGIVVANVGKRYRKPFETSCSLCRILLASRKASLDLNPISNDDEDDVDVLRAFTLLPNTSVYDETSPAGMKFAGENSSAYIDLISSKFPASRHQRRIHGAKHGFAVISQDDARPNIFTAQRVPLYFDSAVAKGWIHYCQKHHGRICSSTNSAPMKNLNLIDCESRIVERGHTQASYVALSYVWGSSTACDQHSPDLIPDGDEFSLPSVLSPVILDAISVTKALGFRYLWVDKFCIDQVNKDVKHQQIQHMDSIYENAEVTIIAAAGVDETYGLPGVGHRPRSAQPIARIGDLTVLSTMTDIYDSIRSSKWSTRGWTFQEAVLSRRRLVFTDEQIYFECGAMNCYESLSGPIDSMHVKDKSELQHFLRAGVFGRNGSDPFSRFDTNPLGYKHVFLQYLTAIEEYTTRELRYHRDSLNAFAGVIRKFEKANNPVFQLWGIPISFYNTQVDLESYLESYFVDALCWNHRYSCWDGSLRPCRRPDFPSWSWAGWAAEVTYVERNKRNYSSTSEFKWLFFSEKSAFRNGMGPMSLEFDSGQVVNLDMRMKDVIVNNGFGTSTPRILRVEANIFPPSSFSCDENGQWTLFGFPATMALSQGPDNRSQFLEQLREKDSGLQCIYAGWFPRNIFGIILETRDGVSSRVGLVIASGWYWNMKKIWNVEHTKRTAFRIV
jgi:hypothetical protein